MKRKPLLILAFTVLGFLVMGYHPGVEDDGVYLTAVKAQLNPTLFPQNSGFFRIQMQATVFDRWMAHFVSTAGVPLAWAELFWQFASLFSILWACHSIARRLFPEETARWCGVAMVAAMFTLPVTGTALYLADQHLHPRNIATALILLAVARILAGKRWQAAPLLLLAFLMHPIMAAMGISFCFFLTISLLDPVHIWLRSRLRLSPGSAAVLVPLGWIFEPPTPAWRAALETRTYYFLFRWTWYEWLGALAPLFLFWLLWRMVRRLGDMLLSRFALSVFAYGIFQQTIAILMLSSPALIRFTPLQPMRYLHLVYFFLALVGGCLLGKYLLKARAWRWAVFLLAVNGGMFASQRALFADSLHLELPGRLPGNPWLQAFAWIRSNTPQDAYFAVDPHYLEAPGEDCHGFRALAERSQMADAVKDSAVVTQVPELGSAWKQQLEAQQGWQHFQLSDFERLKAQFGVDWALVSYRSPPGWIAGGTIGRSQFAEFHDEYPAARHRHFARWSRLIENGEARPFRYGDRRMLNLSQRLILGCVLLVCLTVGLAVAAHTALTAAGQTRLAYALIAASALIAAATIYFVLRPIHVLARDARRIGQGNLEHRVEWSSRDDFGVIAGELSRISVRLRELRDSEAGRRQMEFQLSDAVLQSIFEPIIVTDGKGHVLKLNQAASELLGEAAGDRMALANTPGGDKILSAIRDAVAMQKAVAAEDEAAMLPMRIGKKERSYRLRTMPMRDSEGRLLGTVTTLEDVTSLQDIDRFKTQFIAVASRKLRDPLLQLRRGIYALEQGFSGELLPLQAELVSTASHELEKLDDLMGDLIEVAELDTGKRKLKLERLRPLQALNEARNRYCEDAAEKHIRLEVNAYADLSSVQADRRALRSILDNLLSNALRYTPAEGEILLAAEEIKDFVQFTVRDTGRGIEAERLGSIFDRFNAFSDQSTGLGLALVRRLVESLAGQIAVESRLGHGTTFRFTIPVAVVDAVQHPVEVG